MTAPKKSEWQALRAAFNERHALKLYHLRTRCGKLRRLARLLAVNEFDVWDAVLTMMLDGQMTIEEAYKTLRFLGDTQ